MKTLEKMVTVEKMKFQNIDVEIKCNRKNRKHYWEDSKMFLWLSACDKEDVEHKLDKWEEEDNQIEDEILYGGKFDDWSREDLEEINVGGEEREKLSELYSVYLKIEEWTHFKIDPEESIAEYYDGEYEGGEDEKIKNIARVNSVAQVNKFEKKIKQKIPPKMREEIEGEIADFLEDSIRTFIEEED